jgi:hypothetical protein
MTASNSAAVAPGEAASSSPLVQAARQMGKEGRGVVRSVPMSLIRKLSLVAVAAVGLAGCSTFNPYVGTSIGVGSGYYDPYYGSNYGGYASYGGYGAPYGVYSSPYGGWYSGYYYPGTGAYVYDQQRRRYAISQAQRRYWEQQRILRSRNPAVQQNVRDYRVERRDDRRAYRVERRDDRAAVRAGQVTREAYRADRREDRREYRQDERRDRRELRRENRRDRKPR